MRTYTIWGWGERNGFDGFEKVLNDPCFVFGMNEGWGAAQRSWTQP